MAEVDIRYSIVSIKNNISLNRNRNRNFMYRKKRNRYRIKVEKKLKSFVMEEEKRTNPSGNDRL